MPSFSPKSSGRLETCKRPLVLLCSTVVVYFDITILEGSRLLERQEWLYQNKLTETMKSKHLVSVNNPLSRAVDVAPYPIPADWGSLRTWDRTKRDAAWKERVKFYEMLAIFQYEARRLGIPIRAGNDWDGDRDYRDQSFDDLVHIELLEAA